MTDIPETLLARALAAAAPYETTELAVKAGVRVALAWAKEQGELPCTWTPDHDIDAWDTMCGEAYSFEADGPSENNYNFCPGCGHPIKVV